MKYLILLVALFLGQTLYAQVSIGDNYIFTKEQHDQIKKNLNDYRELIKSFDKMNEEFKNMKEQFELLKALRNNDQVEINRLTSELTKYKVENFAYENLKVQHDNLKFNYEKLQAEVLVLNTQLEHSGRSVGYWSRKYQKQIRYDRGDRIMEGFVFGSMVGAALLLIYNDIITNYMHHN